MREAGGQGKRDAGMRDRDVWTHGWGGSAVGKWWTAGMGLLIMEKDVEEGQGGFLRKARKAVWTRKTTSERNDGGGAVKGLGGGLRNTYQSDRGGGPGLARSLRSILGPGLAGIPAEENFATVDRCRLR